MFHETNRNFTDSGFWPSLMYAVLAGMSDALGIEETDIDGVINPVSFRDGEPTQELSFSIMSREGPDISTHWPGNQICSGFWRQRTGAWPRAPAVQRIRPVVH